MAKEYDIEKNLVCWRCKNAILDKAFVYYRTSKIEEVKRPLCRLIAIDKGFFFIDGFYDIPDPSEPIGAHGCEFVDLGYDIREM